MLHRFQFNRDILYSVAGGRSAIEMPALNVFSLEAASAFIEAYGLQLDSDIEKLWYYHRRAVVLLNETLGFDLEEIPEVLRDRKSLEDIRRLLLFASDPQPENKILQRWSCAILRCMHVFVHSENDLFNTFSEEIQSQILTPLQSAIWNDGETHKTYLKSKINPHMEPIELLGFEAKPFKTSASSVIKLLAKPDALAMRLFDKLGVRFITNNLFDTFQVIRFLVAENIVSFPHIIPDQSSNNIFPVDLFMQVCKDLEVKNSQLSSNELESVFEKALEDAGESAVLLRKNNAFSGVDYKFIKFINRKLIHIKPEGKEAFSFFYPFEIQIMDRKAHEGILSGPSEHAAYKERQREAAKKRLFPDTQL